MTYKFIKDFLHSNAVLKPHRPEALLPAIRKPQSKINLIVTIGLDEVRKFSAEH
jgi:hypothetical protein